MLSSDDDVEPAVVEALDDLGDPRRAADVPCRPLLVAEHDSEALAAVKRAADHALVALLEDVQRHQLARKQDDRKLEDRQLVPAFRHRPILRPGIARWPQPLPRIAG